MKIELFHRWFGFYYFNGSVSARGISIWLGQRNIRVNF